MRLSRDKGRRRRRRRGLAVGKCLQHPVSPRHAYSTRTSTHTLLASVWKGFPCVADESTRGGRLNNRAAQWEAGEGSCSVRAGAITARGSNGEHLATEHHSHSPLFVWSWGWRWRWRGGGWGGVQNRKKGPRLAERLVWPLRECKRKEESVARLKGKKDKCGGRGTSKSFMSQWVWGGDMFLIVAAHSGQMTRKHKSLPLCHLWDYGACVQTAESEWFQHVTSTLKWVM